MIFTCSCSWSATCFSTSLTAATHSLGQQAGREGDQLRTVTFGFTVNVALTVLLAHHPPCPLRLYVVVDSGSFPRAFGTVHPPLPRWCSRFGQNTPQSYTYFNSPSQVVDSSLLSLHADDEAIACSGNEPRARPATNAAAPLVSSLSTARRDGAAASAFVNSSNSAGGIGTLPQG